MSDIKKESDSVKQPPSKLTLKSRVEVSSVQQSSRKSGSGGNTVKVEVRKKRSFSRNAAGKMVADGGAPSVTVDTKNISIKGDDRTLTSQEREQRLKALQQAEVDQAQEQKNAAEEAKRQEVERLKNEAEELKKNVEQRKNSEIEDVAKDTSDSDNKKAVVSTEVGDTNTKIAIGDKKATSGTTKEVTSDAGNDSGKTLSLKSDAKDSTPKIKSKKKSEVDAANKKIPAKGKKSLVDTGKRKNKLTVQNAFNDDIRERSLASLERARKKAKRQQAGNSGASQVKIVREVVVPEVITVSELANRMATRTTDVIRELMKMGSLLKATDNIDFDTAEIIVEEFGHTIKKVQASDIEDILKDDRDFEEDRVSRAPIVTIMGHVDHGKTSLLDALRNTDVVTGEAGGITQHIGAYKVRLKDGNEITFLDTPGHEAFTAMRMRGANVTDIVILVVAADDGIMEQTIEAINHARAAEVPIIVAINKIDKPDADPSRVLNELLQHEIVAESFGGDVMTVEVSAKQKLGLDTLEEAILLQSEILELKASNKCFASGIVVESSVDKNRGVVATLLVQKGTLSVGDIAVVGSSVGKVRAMRDDKGRPLQSAGPADPVEVLGLDCAPEAGEVFNYVENEKNARNIAEYRLKVRKDLENAAASKTTLSDLLSRAAGTGVKELCVIIKGDVQGSIEAIASSLLKMNTEEVAVKIVHSAVGGITESDVNLARASSAFIVGFNVRANTAAKALSETENVNLRYYSIIYDLINDVKTVLSGMLAPAIKEKHIGNAVIRQVFNITKSGKIAGCYVTDGIIRRGAGVRLLRDNIVVHEGKLKTLKRFKDEVPEVNKNFECGMAFENYEDIKENDIIEAFELIEEAREL